MTRNQTRRTEARLWDLIGDVEVAMLTTVDAHGALQSRPLATVKIDEPDGDLWFFTAKDSPKVEQIQREQHVNLAYADPRSGTYVSVNGVATLSQDRKRIDELWSPLQRAWFPHGKDDPKLTLLRVRVVQAQYWSHAEGWIRMMIDAARAAVSGESAAPSADENAKISLRAKRR